MELKHFGKNVVVYGFGDIALRFGQFLLVPIYTHYLTQGEYGLLITLFVTVEILVIFMGLQMAPTFMRYFQKYKKEAKLGYLLGTSLALLLLGICIVVFIGYLITKIGFVNFRYNQIIVDYFVIIVLLAGIRCIFMFVVSFFRAANEAIKFTLFNILCLVFVLIICSIALIKLHLGLKAVIISHTLGYGLSTFLILFFVLKRAIPKISFKIAPELLYFGLPLILSAAAWFILQLSDTYFLAHYRNFEEVAIYGLGYKIARFLPSLVVLPFQRAFGPYTFSILDRSDVRQKLGRIFFYLIISLLLGAISLAVASPFILKIIAPPQYALSYLVVLCILPVGFFLGVYYWASALIHIVRKTYIIGIIMALATVANLMLNYLLIPKYGWLGAAIATNISFFFASCIIFILGMNFYPVPIKSQVSIGLKEIFSFIKKLLYHLKSKVLELPL
jgi:O-antigen/teichoic acid export membrane protein